LTILGATHTHASTFNLLTYTQIPTRIQTHTRTNTHIHLTFKYPDLATIFTGTASPSTPARLLLMVVFN